MDIYGLIEDHIIPQMTPVITLTSIEVVSAGVYKLNSCNTEWAMPDMTITIEGEDYVISEFVQNESLTVTGSVEPTQLYFQLSAPHFEWGSHRKTNIERGMQPNKVPLTPMVYMFPTKNIGIKTYDSPYSFEGNLRIFFLTRFDPNNEIRQVQQDEVINPMKAMADYFMDKLDDRQDLFDDIVKVSEFDWMDFGDPEIWGNKEKIFDENLSGVERGIDVKVFDFEDCCESIPSNSCLPVVIKKDGVFQETVESGGVFNYNTETGDPVTNSINGVGATSTPAGEAQAINVHDSAGADIGTVTVDTANVKTIEVANSSFSVNGNAKTGTKAEGSKAVQIVDQDGNTLTVTDLIDTDTVYKGEVTSAVTKRVYYNRPYLTQTTPYNDYDEQWRMVNGGNDYNDNRPALSLVQEIKPDLVNGRFDYLKYFNKWGNKFRFTGENGGYYDEADGNYYDKDGNLSDLATAYPELSSGNWMVFDNLTGYAIPNRRGGAATWADAMNQQPTYQFAGYGTAGDYFAPCRDEAMMLDNNSNIYQSLDNPSNRPFFNSFNIYNWTSTTSPNNSAQAYAYLGTVIGGFVNIQQKTPANAAIWFWTIFDNTYVTQP